MAFDALVLEEPNPTHGFPFQRPAASGEWRYCLELADPSAGEYAEWFDLTQFYAGDRYQRGADEYMGRYRAAVAQVQLQIDNVHADQEGISRDILAPWGQDTTELFGTNVELDAGLFMRFAIFRVVGGVTVEWSPIWTGRVETWGDAAYARGQVRIHNVTVVDLLSDLVNVPVLLDDSWAYLSVFFDDALTQADWLYGDDFYGDDLAGGPAYENPTPVITVLDTTCDSMGLVWRTLRSGRLVIHPAPWDTTNTDRYDNPLLDVYPDGVKFVATPSSGEIEYITDDEQEPFGITRTSLGIVNSIAASMPDGFSTVLYPIDDPVSKDRYGAKPVAVTFNIANEPVADELLAARAYASKQALPLRTSIDHEGFWSAMALVDHLDPVTVVHSSHSGGSVVTAAGTVRNITEERAFRNPGALSWQTTIQLDVTSTEVTAAILPVEDLLVIPDAAPLLGGDSSAQATWTNPTQPEVTPTDVEYRVLGKSLIWNPATYDGVGPSGMSLGNLDAATTYTLQVRLIRQVDGVTTAVSPVRSYVFTTPALILPTPIPDGDSTDVEIPDIADEGCTIELELQEFDGMTWTTIQTWDDPADFVDNGDGTFSLAYPIDNEEFADDKVYRFRSREVCDGDPGEWIVGDVFDPPEDWTDPCATPPALLGAPFDDPDLLVYVPKVCAE